MTLNPSIMDLLLYHFAGLIDYLPQPIIKVANDV
jgi:hypothetical protein